LQQRRNTLLRGRRVRDASIAFATSAAVGGITDDDLLLAQELQARGHSVEPEVWDGDTSAWQRYDAVMVRSTWDYHLRADSFLDWIADLESLGTRIWNAPALLRWNAEKWYLRDLAASGIRIVDTQWVDQHEQTSLARIIEEQQWEQFVVKPAISASAHRTWRGSIAEATLLEANFRAAVTHGDVLVQRYLPQVASEGEWSLLFYGGYYSHSVLKTPRADDFRVQREHGGTSRPLDAPKHLIDAARAALGAAEKLNGPAVYARVDGCMVNAEFVLMELELIEPDLFLRAHPDAPRRLADALDL
jgi:hypothetical protein